jgi:hypothetical protein
MASTLVRVLPLALGGAISPVILLLQIATLASQSHRIGRCLLVITSNMLVVVVIMAAVVFGDHHTSSDIAADAPTNPVAAWIRIVLAILLAATALRLIIEQLQAPTTGSSDLSSATTTESSKDQPFHPVRYFLIGLGAMVSNATTIVLLIPATHTVATANLQPSQALVLYAIVTAIVLLPSYLPLVVFMALGQRGPMLMNRFGDWLHTHQRTIGIVVSLGFAIYLGWTGFNDLR